MAFMFASHDSCVFAYNCDNKGSLHGYETDISKNFNENLIRSFFLKNYIYPSPLTNDNLFYIIRCYKKKCKFSSKLPCD